MTSLESAVRANLELSFPGRDEAFSVRSFRVQAAISAPFSVSVWLRSEHDDADLDALAGCEARFSVVASSTESGPSTLAWTGICSHIELVHAEPTGLSTYHLTLVPRLWLLGQRTSCRVFQRMTAPEMAAAVLREWGIDPELRLQAGAYPTLDYRVQYNETDLSFVSRMLEETGVSYFFRTIDGRSRIVLADRPGTAPMAGAALPFVADTSTARGQRHATQVYRASHVRPTSVRVRDYDFRNPTFELYGGAGTSSGRLERYQHVPAASLAVTGPPGGAVADDRGAVSADTGVLAAVALRRLDAARLDSRVLSFQTSAIELEPGAITAISDHPRSDLGAEVRLLVSAATLSGTVDGGWGLVAHAVFAADPFRPALSTPKPRILGVQSAAVVGPEGEDIHTDEFGRVRVLFPWDREGARADASSCWVRVSQAAAGAGFGLSAIPRVGDEVLVAFLDGDPDQPVVVGRLHNATHLHPYHLPEEKAVSGWKTLSSPGGGYNELSFDDRQGGEVVHLRAQRNLDESVVADHFTNVGHERRLTVGAARAVHVGASDALLVGGDRSVQVGGSAAHAVAGASASRVDGARSTLVGGDDGLAVGRNLVLKAGEMFHVIAGTAEPSDAVIQASGCGHVFSKDTLHLKSSTSVEITCGATRLVLTPEGITLKAKHVRVEGTEDVLLVHETSQIKVAGSIGVGSDMVTIEGSGSSITLDSNAQVKGAQVTLGGSDGSSRQSSSTSSSPDRATFHVVMPDGHEGPLTLRIALPSGEVVERCTDGNNQVVLQGQPGERFTLLEVRSAQGATRWSRTDG